jgi:glycerol uptake facilitator-like aquaporin
VSGGHINPAVTIGVMVSGQMSVIRGLLYMVVQYIGALIGAGLLKVIMGQCEFTMRIFYLTPTVLQLYCNLETKTKNGKNIWKLLCKVSVSAVTKPLLFFFIRDPQPYSEMYT